MTAKYPVLLGLFPKGKKESSNREIVGGKCDLVPDLIVRFLHRWSSQARQHPGNVVPLLTMLGGRAWPHIFLVILAVTFINHRSI